MSWTGVLVFYHRSLLIGDHSVRDKTNYLIKVIILVDSVYVLVSNDARFSPPTIQNWTNFPLFSKLAHLVQLGLV